MDKLIEEIDNRCNLSDTEMTLLRQTLRILHFPKGSIVIGEGKTDDSIYFLDKGVWRAYIEEEGEQQTLWFAIPRGDHILFLGIFPWTSFTLHNLFVE